MFSAQANFQVDFDTIEPILTFIYKTNIYFASQWIFTNQSTFFWVCLYVQLEADVIDDNLFPLI